jgi:hypothetical protein
MKKPTRWFYVGLALGIPAALLESAALMRHSVLELSLVIGASIGALLSLPIVMAQARRDAVPANRSDFIGYGAIGAVLLVIAGIIHSKSR